MADSNVAVILPAAGSGKRFGRDENKLFAKLAGRPIWQCSAANLRGHHRVSRIIVPVSQQDRTRFEGEFADVVSELNLEIVAGGAERTDSVRAGFQAVSDDASIRLIAIHDAARPLVRHRDLDQVFAKADTSGAAVLAVPVTATVKQSYDSGASCHTVDRSTLWLAQTPQVFSPAILRRAYGKHRGRPATDDAELVSRIGVDVCLVPGSSDNLKITHPNDLIVAEAILNSQTENGHA